MIETNCPQSSEMSNQFIWIPLLFKLFFQSRHGQSTKVLNYLQYCNISWWCSNIFINYSLSQMTIHRICLLAWKKMNRQHNSQIRIYISTQSFDLINVFDENAKYSHYKAIEWIRIDSHKTTWGKWVTKHHDKRKFYQIYSQKSGEI